MKKFVLPFILCFATLGFAHENAPPKAVICAACHGEQGHSMNPQWPNLAGQHAKYILKQLHNMLDAQQRNVPTMTAIVSSLSEEEMHDLAIYYAKLPLVQGSTPQHYRQRGEQLYRGGDFSKHITACIACHGPQGTGNEQAGFPILSGQHAAYTILQLLAFKEGLRNNDLNHIMHDISQRMSQDDMEAVAHYIEGLH